MQVSAERHISCVDDASRRESRPTRRTRVWRAGVLEREGFPASEVRDYLEQPDTLVWLDICGPDAEELEVVREELGLDALAIEDAVSSHERPKLDRYPTHLFLNAYAVELDVVTGRLATHEVSAFVTKQALVTVRGDHHVDVDTLIDYWDTDPDLAKNGSSFLLHGLLDVLVDQHFDAVQTLDGEIEQLEDALFDDEAKPVEVQRRSYELRKSLVLLRRVVLPMREVVNSLMRRDLHVIPPEMAPYFQDLYDHVLRATEWTESLRDLVTTILDTNLTIQSNRLNVVMKKLTGWAAIIAVPTAVTGFYGQNVPYPGFEKEWGFVASVVILVGTALALYIVMKKRDWL